jgi:type I restriction enzyme S subunit
MTVASQDWQSRTLGDCADWLSGGTPFKGNPSFWSGAIPWISAKDMKSFRLHDAEDHISDSAVGHGGKVVAAGTILLLVRGMTLHNDVPISVVMRDMAFNQDIKAIRTKPDVDSQFLAYWLLAHKPDLLSAVDHAGHGTGRLLTDLLKGMVVSLPPKTEQEAIAQILIALDNKIELNQQTNETLEELAHTIFKSSFVDATAIELPKGWRESTIGEEVRVVGGSTPSTTKPEFWAGGTHHWATPKDLAPLDSPVLLNTERKISELGLEQIGSGLLPVGTVLLSSRAPIGYMAIAEVPVAVNQGFIAIICNGSLPNHYVRLWTKQNMEAIKGRANGTTFMEISKSNFRTLPVLVPPQTLLDEFQQQVEPLHRRVVSNLEESRTLAELRDALLPKLLSGELRVPAK